MSKIYISRNLILSYVIQNFKQEIKIAEFSNVITI